MKEAKNKIKRSTLEMLQVMLDRMNTKINLETEIDIWNHYCANENESIIIEEEE